MAKNTIIDGIAASEHLDSSGESLSIDGMDISSLGGSDSILNWEHGSKERPSQVVGKVTFARKIFKASDAKNKREKYFWNKVKKPFVYIKAELFDGIGHSGAQDVAAMLKYKNRDKGKKSRLVVGFSIEGGKMDKKGMVVTKSIARDVAITVKPCNKVCDAEIAQSDESDDFLYKNQDYDCEILQKGEFVINSRSYRDLIVSDIKKSFPKLKQDYQSKVDSFKDTKSFKQKSDKSDEIGKLASKPIGKPANAKPKRQFDSKSAPSTLKVGDRIKYEKKKMKTGKDIYNNPDTWKSENNMRKALVAGMMNAAPSALTGGAALASEDLMGAIQDVTNKKKNKKKIKKNHPAISFPMLGIENDPKSQVKRLDPKTMKDKAYKTTSGKEYSQADIEGKKIANKFTQNKIKKVKRKYPEYAETKTTADQNLNNKMAQRVSDTLNPERKAGTAMAGSGLESAYDYSKEKTREEMKANNGKGNFPSTQQHEGLHLTLGKIENVSSQKHRSALVNHMLDNFFEKDDLKDIQNMVEGIGYKSKPGVNIREEYLTHIMDLIQNPKKREYFHKQSSHANSGELPSKEAIQKDWDRMNRLKSGYLSVVKAMKSLDSKQLEDIYKKSQKKQPRKKVEVERVAPGVSGIKR